MVVDTKNIYTPPPSTAAADSIGDSQVGLAPEAGGLDVRGDFPIFARRFEGKPLVYLDSGATSQKPSAVIEAMDIARGAGVKVIGQVLPS